MKNAVIALGMIVMSGYIYGMYTFNYDKNEEKVYGLLAEEVEDVSDEVRQKLEQRRLKKLLLNELIAQNQRKVQPGMKEARNNK